MDTSAKLVNQDFSFNFETLLRATLEAEALDFDVTDPFGNTLLMVEVMKNNAATVTALLTISSININATNEEGETALMHAVKIGDAAVVEILLKADGIEVNKVDKRGNTVLMLAVIGGNTAIVRALLARRDMQVQINAVDLSGHTALMKAAIWGDTEMVKVLLDVPKLYLNKKNKLGDSALQLASKMNHIEIVDMLFKASATRLAKQLKKQPEAEKALNFNLYVLSSNKPVILSKKPKSLDDLPSKKTSPRNSAKIPVLVR